MILPSDRSEKSGMVCFLECPGWKLHPLKSSAFHGALLRQLTPHLLLSLLEESVLLENLLQLIVW
jgi:hypothetical protein